MTARRHHYVPQCYLNGFVADREKPKLFVVDLETRSTFETAPANVAAERDFHAIDITGHAPDALENAFSDFETKLDQALKRIVAARSIFNDNDRALVFELMAIIAVKNPRLRENFSSVIAHTAKMIMDLATSTPERWAAQVRAAKRDGFLAADVEMDYAEMRAFVESGEYEIETPTMEHLRVELPTVEKVMPHIAGRKWMLFRAPPGSTFITSDHPISLMWANPAERGRMQPPGFGLTKTQVLFPLAQELAMIGAFEMHDEERETDALQVAQINGSTFLHCKRQVYGRDGGFPYKLNHNAEIRRGNQLLDDPGLFGRNGSASN
jgi:Protein of unknown function (DUF4238)